MTGNFQGALIVNTQTSDPAVTATASANTSA
jgi:hypothetical protein